MVINNKISFNRQTTFERNLWPEFVRWGRLACEGLASLALPAEIIEIKLQIQHNQATFFEHVKEKRTTKLTVRTRSPQDFPPPAFQLFHGVGEGLEMRRVGNVQPVPKKHIFVQFFLCKPEI